MKLVISAWSNYHWLAGTQSRQPITSEQVMYVRVNTVSAFYTTGLWQVCDDFWIHFEQYLKYITNFDMSYEIDYCQIYIQLVDLIQCIIAPNITVNCLNNLLKWCYFKKCKQYGGHYTNWPYRSRRLQKIAVEFCLVMIYMWKKTWPDAKH